MNAKALVVVSSVLMVVIASQTRLPSSKLTAFRVSNFSKAKEDDPEAAKKDIVNILEEWCEMDEEKEYSVHIIPCCTDKSFRRWLALVVFRHGRPWFLRHSDFRRIGIHFDPYFFGFTQLYPTSTSGDRIVADIIAVTGLGGHAFGSWVGRETGKMWLRDFLKDDFPDCRVLIYGHDFKPRERCKDSILSFVDTFLANLEGIRSNPVVFSSSNVCTS
jgi:hypothetical protein